MVPEQAEFPSVQSVPRLLVKSWCCPYSAEAESLAGGWRIDGVIDNERLLRASSSRVFTESRDLMLGLCAPVSAMYMSDLSSGRLRWLWRLRRAGDRGEASAHRPAVLRSKFFLEGSELSIQASNELQEPCIPPNLTLVTS